MTPPPPRTPDSLPLSRALRVDKACDRFENAWRANQRPRIEDYLGDTPEPERSELLRELMRLDAHYRNQASNPEPSPMRPPSSTPAVSDRNLLFGILALQMDFISRDALVAAMNGWVLDKTKPLGSILVEQKALSNLRHGLLEALVQEHLQAHGNDAQASLVAIGTVDSIRPGLENIADLDLHASLAFVADSKSRDGQVPSAQSTTVGGLTSAGERFRILRPHLKGGLGQVSVALDAELHREVALKEIQEQYAQDPHSRARFLLEAEITGGLEHPGIVPVYGLGCYPDGRPYYAMRFIKGDSLKEAIEGFHRAEVPGRDAGERTLALRQVLARFVALCNAVAYAHSRGVIHRDLKPANVMLGSYGETLVVDWGLAKAVGRSEVNGTPGRDEITLRPTEAEGMIPTLAGKAMGTPAYMSPEQAAGRWDIVGPPSDVYSLGATLYCLLTGKAPFDGRDVGEILRKVQRGHFLTPRQFKREVPSALEAVCLKAMALRPEDRYASPRALADDLEHWLADEPVTAYREPARVRLGRWCRRHRALVTGLAVAFLVVLVGAGAFGWWYQEEQARQAAEQAQREKEQALRLARVEQEVDGALREASALADKALTLTDQAPQWRSTLEAAWSALRVAESSLAKEGMATGPALRGRFLEVKGRVDQGKRDLDMAARIEEIGLGILAPGPHGNMDLEGTRKRYREAFRDYGLDVEALTPTESARRLKGSAIREKLVAGLDEWLSVKVAGLDEWLSVKGEAQDYQRLLALVQTVDENKMRQHIRAAREAGRKAELMSLVQDVLKEEIPASTTLLLGNALFETGSKMEAVRVLEHGQRAHPADVWLNVFLASYLYLDPRRHAEAVGYWRAALATRPDSPFLHNDLGAGLMTKDPKSAIAAFKQAIRLRPDFATAYYALGFALSEVGDPEGAIASCKKAIELDKNDPLGYFYLADSLVKKGDPEGAVVAFKEAIRLNEDFFGAHFMLGNELFKKGDLKGAIVALKKAVHLKPDDPTAHFNLGNALFHHEDLDEAIAALKKAVSLKADYAKAHISLGLALDQNGDSRAAIAAFKDAIRLKKDPGAYYGMGIALLSQGRFQEALEAMRAAPSAQGVGLVERMVELDRKLPAFLEGKAKIATAAEAIELTDVCRYKRYYAAATRFAAEAFALDAKVAEDLGARYRYQAAWCAALAGSGQNKDPGKLDDKEQGRLRRQAVAWLRADLALWAKQFEDAQPQNRVTVQKKLQQWQRDPDLAGIREPARLAQLPLEEQVACEKLWADVWALIAKEDLPFLTFGKVVEVVSPQKLDWKNPHQVTAYAVWMCREGKFKELLKQMSHVEEDLELGKNLLAFIREFGSDLERYKYNELYLKFHGYSPAKDATIWCYYLVTKDGKNLDKSPWVSTHRSRSTSRCALTGIFLYYPDMKSGDMPKDLVTSLKRKP